jgi:hypothetical protein
VDGSERSRHLQDVVESIAVNVGGWQQDGKVRSPPMPCCQRRRRHSTRSLGKPGTGGRAPEEKHSLGRIDVNRPVKSGLASNVTAMTNLRVIPEAECISLESPVPSKGHAGFGRGSEETCHKATRLAPTLQLKLDGPMRTLSRAALVFCLMHRDIATTVPGVKNVAEVEELAGCVALPPIPPAHLTRLRALYARGFRGDSTPR